jgi:DNA-binding response OmpR family regulator
METGLRVLVVEDEPQMAGFIAKGLRNHDYIVEIASDGLQSLVLMKAAEHDLVILDLQLPGKDGRSVCRELRAEGCRTPILMVTALAGATDVVDGLNCGADDYLSKPFDFGVLLARVRAVLRRASQVRSDMLQVADLSLNTVDHTAARGGRAIPLTGKEYALLELLMLHAGEILGRAQIAEHVWDESFDPLSNIIDVYMKRLRKKVDYGFETRLIHTRRSEGYMLSADAASSPYV